MKKEESHTTDSQFTPLDLRDVEQWVGRPLAIGQLKEPITTNDIRRWVQGMQNPNRLYYDEGFARDGAFQQIVAPQSFMVCCTPGLGAVPAMQGNIPDVHMLLGGDEYWFYGPRIKPGDRIRTDAMLFDYRLTETRFGGPTLFSRGDTTFFNQDGEALGKLRSTSIRYNPDNARKLNALAEQQAEPQWTAAQLARLEEDKFAYYQTIAGHVVRGFDSVHVGDALPVRPIGPHSIQSFTTEWRSFIFTVWGSQRDADLACAPQGPSQTFHDADKARIDPAYSDGLYVGPSRKHVSESDAHNVGVPRGYGYGAVIGAWVLDYLGNWAGERGLVIHSNVRYTSFPLTGDATFFHAQVVDKRVESGGRYGIVSIDVEMKNQNGIVMGKGRAELRLAV